MKNIIVIFSVILWSPIMAQGDFWTEVPAILKAVENAKKYQVTIDYSMYLDGNLAVPFQTKRVELKCSGDQLNIKQDGVFELIETSKLILNVSHRDKRIYFFQQRDEILNEEEEKPETPGAQELYQFFVVNRKSAESKINRINLISETGGIRTYEILLKEGEFSKIVIAINASKSELKHSIVFYRSKQFIGRDTEQPRDLSIKVEYNNYKANPAFDPHCFSIARFLHNKPGAQQPELNSSLKNYQLIVY